MGASKFFYGGLVLTGIVLAGAELRKPEAPAASPPTSPIQERAEMPAVSNGLGSIALQRGPDSHFYADALVNGTRIRFLIDTGASSVVLTAADAQRAGLGAGNYDAKGIGAGGEIRLMPVTLTRLALGPLMAESVPAMVAEEGSLPVSLLGQSFLGKVDSVTIKGDEMILR